ncbi:hypothetical protein IMG5_180790 [Ichthyophthirius multifiliis]|uniref:CC2D2A N-terminal C2 domain-containing protein n=1 Tax=Ichthyophthirius multifiliis TaxID=5932 RepID=G0R2R7_ICHMU|nr:hypothetical protein IMG5_180790 [Ichthyophthirius multifiliis]EGR28239.1 hypothetical protein IMG5_180790 [Ichthyophthirius multifiliis]|eukprot:XP_004027584.1 hypothetical protein IMG5_180790 [Ichthyophthirius multifiliis]
MLNKPENNNQQIEMSSQQVPQKNQEKKKDYENEQQIQNLNSELQQYNSLLYMPKSDFFSDIDRQAAYEDISSLLRTVGFLGLSRINMSDIDYHIIMRKAQIEGREEVLNQNGNQENERTQVKLFQVNMLVIFLQKGIYLYIIQKKDGLYITSDSQQLFLLEEQRQKQRMMNNDRYLCNFFKTNGDLVIDQEFYENKISKIRIISFHQNLSLATKRRTAVMCERLNQNKHIPYRLRVYIGKIVLTKHFRMIKEDLQMQELKELIKKYKDRCDLALIPVLDKSIKLIEQEIAEFECQINRQPLKEIAILKNERNNLCKLVQDEANLLKDLMFEIIEKWKQIQATRIATKMNCSPFRLYARQYRNNENGNELELGLGKEAIMEDKDVDGIEQKRRKQIRKDKIFVELVVNGQVVTRSKSCFVEWPSYEVKIMEQFYILVFTRPSSMQLRVIQDGILEKIIDVIEVEIPGDKSRSITASAQIIKEYEFCFGANQRKIFRAVQIENEKKKLLLKSKEKLTQIQGKKEENKKKDENNENKKEEQEEVNKKENLNIDLLNPQELEELRKEEEKKILQMKIEELNKQEEEAKEKALYKGRISILSEWTGQGDRMPPQNIDNFGKGGGLEDQSENDNPQNIVKKIQIDNGEEEGFHFDVNDPRNELQIEQLRQLRYRDQRTKVERDLYLPFAHIMSLRQRLIKCSLINPDVGNIPIFEEEIFNSEDLMKVIEDTEKGIFLNEENMEELNRIEKKGRFLEDVAISHKEVFDAQKKETKKRIENIKRILLQRQNFAKVKKQNNQFGAPLVLKNVVNEYRIDENEIILFELIKQCFTQQRKLQPKKKKEEKIRLVDIQDNISIFIHISHGTNVPMRDDSVSKAQFNNLVANRQMKLLNNIGFQAVFMQNMQGNMPMNMMGNMPMIKQIKPIDFKNINELERVNSYVQIKLIFEKQEQIVCSKPFEGNNPDWSSERQLLIQQLQNRKISVYEINNQQNRLLVSLFDLKITKKKSKTKLGKETKITHSFYLGHICIPLFTLFSNQKLNATFRVNRPIIILGYYTDINNLLGFDSEYDPQNTLQAPPQPLNQESKIRIDPQIPTTLNMSINIEPFVEISQENDQQFYGENQDSRLQYIANIWFANIKKKPILAKRHIKLFGNDIEQNSFFLPRYISRLKPPNIFVDGINEARDIRKDPHAIEKVARFVSLIPFKNDTDHFKDIPDIHCDSQQFLDLKGGDFEEHAFLLCNYFNYIDFYSGREHIKSYVLLGHAIPEGQTFYTLRRDTKTNKVEIWNPSTGEPYVMTTEIVGTQFLCCTIGKKKQSVISKYDKACPLYDVGCLIDGQNVYVNIQNSGSPGQIDWKVEDVKFWQPFLSKVQYDSIFGENGIEPQHKNEDSLIYEDTPIEPVQRLEKTIQSYLENRIIESRYKEVNYNAEHTSFTQKHDFYIRDNLLQWLEQMKYKCRLSGLGSDLSENQNGYQEKYQNAKITLEKIQGELDEYIRSGENLYGFPLNLSFTSVDKVWDELKHTGIHEILASDMKYICSVKCYSYPNFIISVWVFVGIVYS